MAEESARSRPIRYLPAYPLPPYAYVPGGSFPHPSRNPQGHGFRLPPAPALPPNPAHWRSCRPYLFGIDLFNHGFYWEAHEAWESLWHACGRSGILADFLKGLIKLAAAGVKVREGKPQGVRNHARGAAELFGRVAATRREGRYLGLPLAELRAWAEAVADRPPSSRLAPGVPVDVVFDFRLQLL